MICKKVNFHSLEQAEERAEYHFRRDKGTRKGKFKLRAYKCDRCEFWHLTSKKTYKELPETDTVYPDHVIENKIKQLENKINKK